MFNRLFSIAFIGIFLTGCLTEERHNAYGRWSGTLMKDGLAVDVGAVIIGNDFIDIPHLDESYRLLSFIDKSNTTYFGRTPSGNFQGDQAQLLSSANSGEIFHPRKGEAELVMNNIQGTIYLKKH